MARGRRIGALLVLALLIVPSVAHASERSVAPVAQLPMLRATSLRAASPPSRSSHAFRPVHPAALRAARAQVRHSASPAAAPQRTGRNAAVFGGLNQQGIIASDNSSPGSPPDTTGAIGPANYVEFVNTVIRVYDRSLNPLDTMPGDAFVGASGANVFDIQVQWDPVAQRWFYLTDVCDTTDCSGTNGLAFGWSKTASPLPLGSAGWCRFAVGSGTNFFDDYPKLGHDDNHIIFGSNLFVGTATNASTGRIFSVPKPANGDTSCTPTGTVTVFSDDTHPLLTSDSDVAFTPIPANTANSQAAGLIASADDPTSSPVGPRSQIMVWHMAGGPTTPDLQANGNIDVSSYDFPDTVPQPGALSQDLDALDARLTQGVAMADPDAGGAETFWTQHTVRGGAGAVVRWYELNPATLSARQEGTISPPGLFAFNGAISPAMNGRDAVIDYNVGSSSQLAQIRAQSRKGSAPLGQMGGEITLASSAAADQDFTCTPPFGPPCRWGDYAAASPDPAAADLVWGSNQFIGPTPLVPDDAAWSTQNFALSANTRPTAVLSASRNPVEAGQPVTLSAAGSGDPDGTIVDYQWDVDGDGTFETNSGATPSVSHTYTALGPVTVRLRVVDDSGGTTDAQQTLTVRDTTPPHLKLSFKRVQKIASVRRRGVTGSVASDENATATFQIVIPGKIAKRLHITRTVRIGRKSLRLTAGKRTKVAIKLTRKAKAKLKQARRVTVTLKITAKDAVGNPRRATRKIVLKR